MFGHMLYTLSNDNKMRVWNMKTGKLISEADTFNKDYNEFKCKL
jgi:WD40 repeat protein